MDKPAICGGEPVRDTKIFYGHQYIDDADIQAVVEVLKSDTITCGPKITELEEKLCRIEGAEAALMKLGFSDFRIRMFHDSARVQLPDAQMDQFVAVRESVTEALKPYFNIILLDMQPR